METFWNVINTANGFLFSDFVVYALLFTGVVFTLWSGFGQYRALTHGVGIVRGKYDKKDDPGAISHFQALSSALTMSLFCTVPQMRPPVRLPSVVLLGDSIRINYQATVTAQLAGQASVWSPSKNGAHTAFTLNHLEEWLKDRNPSVVHINVGLHDLFLNAKTGKPRHSLQVYDQNLRAIFVKLRELTDAEILFALTTDVDEQRQAASTTYGRIVRRRADVGTYNARAREIAKQFQVRVNDLPAAMRSAGIQRMLAQDGIHLSEAGKRVLGQQVARQVLAALRRGRKPVP